MGMVDDFLFAAKTTISIDNALWYMLRLQKRPSLEARATLRDKELRQQLFESDNDEEVTDSLNTCTFEVICFPTVAHSKLK